MNLIDIQNVTKRYDHHVALDNVSFAIPKGIVFGLLGPNGAGKTTLIRMLNHITYPDSGTILFKGHSLKQDDVKDIGYLPEERGLYQQMKVGEEALYLTRLKGLSKDEAMRRLKVKLEQYNLTDRWNRPVGELSKGMQQKLQFIITTLHKPDFLILDEPFSGFDPINANLLKADVLKLKDEGATIILSTHNMASVEEICDEIVLINQGHKILEGELYDVKQRFKKNQYSMEVQTNQQEALTERLGAQFEISQQKFLPHSISYSIRTPQGLTANDLLQTVMNFGQLVKFEEVLPTMNEIFIEQVESYNRQSSHE